MSVSTSGLELKSGHRAWRRTVELFSSMRFAISLLVVLAIASIIGTVLTQADPYPNYVNQFGPFWADIFRTIGLYNVYSTWWFVLIILFLVVSITLCVARNGPKIIADTRSWKDRVREGSLKAFHHRGEYRVGAPRDEVAARLRALATEHGYRHVERVTEPKASGEGGATLIAAKRGTFSKVGYIFAHLAIVIIFLGGLLDSNVPIYLQMWLLHKTPVTGNSVINVIPPEHRLAQWNPSFRGNAWVPEGQQVSTAILNEPSGSLIQDLPFSIELKKFIVNYYSTGMPKLFASDIVVIDHKTGARIPARVEVNEPFIYDNIAIYQSSFQDGGSTLQMTGFPMSGAQGKPFAFSGAIGGTAPLGAHGKGDTIEFADFRAINVENVSSGGGQQDARGVSHTTLKQAFDERLGSGAKTSAPKDLRNVGPSIQYKVRDANGQAREYNNYMLPVEVNGERVFLAGMRANPDDAFRYLRIPADADSSVNQWMLIRAALADPAMRAEAARRFAQRSIPTQATDVRQRLDESAMRVLTLFAGDDPEANAAHGGQPDGGFQAIAAFIDKSVPKAEQEKAASLLLRMLEGATWDLWQVAREQANLPPQTPAADTSRFVQSSLNALSDSFFYGAPVYLKLDSFKQIQASVFQLARAPGKKIVYLGSIFLVLGIFSMFYIRERRLWFWLKDSEQGTSVLMAMSTARHTLDFDKEFARMRATVAVALGDPPPSEPATDPTK